MKFLQLVQPWEDAYKSLDARVDLYLIHQIHKNTNFPSFNLQIINVFKKVYLYHDFYVQYSFLFNIFF